MAKSGGAERSGISRFSLASDKHMKIQKLLKYLPLTKVDEVNHTVYGLSTAEVVDKGGEIADYEAMVPQYRQWSAEASTSTAAAGQEVSLGNVRMMHNLQIAGKVTGIDYKDDDKEIHIATEPADDSIWSLIKKGMIRGFSQSGNYIWRKCEVCGTDMTEQDKKKFNYCPKCKKDVVVRYASTIAEVSYVDNPCLGAATFAYIKADGSQEVRKFAEVEKKDTTKRVDGEDLSSSAFLIVGDKDDTSTWKLPVKFSSKAKTKTHLRNALARFDQLKDVSEEEKKSAWARLERLCKEYGIKVSDDDKKTATLKGNTMIKSETRKSMYSISRMAELLQSISYLRDSSNYEGEYEDDERDFAIAEDLGSWLKDGVQILKDIVEDETSELLTAAKAATTNERSSMFETELQKLMSKRAAGLSGHFRKAAAFHAKKADLHDCMGKDAGEMMEACKAMMDHHSEAMKADVGDDEKEAHKAHQTFVKSMTGLCKSMVSSHEKLHKAHLSHSEHLVKMADSAEEESAKDKDDSKDGKKEPAKAVAAAAGADNSAMKYSQEDLDKAVEAAKKTVTAAVVTPPADAVAAKAAGADGSKENDKEKEMTPEQMTKAIADGVDAYMKKRTEETAVQPPPAGFSFIPRIGMEKAAGVAAGGDSGQITNDDDIGI